ncbi:MAG: hypothetical protein M3451_13265 [Chloroflexota bacterium]|nr:hypothetical protein [Chloroflexota bacterium]
MTRLDRAWQSRILDYLEDGVANLADSRSRGKALSSNLSGL